MLITSHKKKHLFLIRSAKFRERIEAAVSSAQRASKYALQKADIAVSRTATARSKAEMADTVADHARIDSEVAVATAREFAPDFKPSVLDRFEKLRIRDRYRTQIDIPLNSYKSPNTSTANSPKIVQAEKRTAYNAEPGPPSQTSVPHTSIRRTSLLQKQVSIGYSGSAGNNAFAEPSMLATTISSQSSNYDSVMSPNTAQHHLIQKQKSKEYQYSHHDSPSYNMPNQNHLSHQYQSHQFNSNFGSHVSPAQDMYVNTNNLPLSNQSMMQQQSYDLYNTQLQPNKINKSYENYVSDIEQYQPNQEFQQQKYHSQTPYESNSNQILSQMQTSEPPHVQSTPREPNEGSRHPHIGSVSQSSIDHFDHYKRPPSRDSSVDRYARATNRLSSSRQPSLDRTVGITNPALSNPIDTETTARAGSAFRNIAPPVSYTGNGSVLQKSMASPQTETPLYKRPSAQFSNPNQPFEDILLRQRTLGQDIIPSPREPKRTESLYLPPKPTNNFETRGDIHKGKVSDYKNRFDSAAHCSWCDERSNNFNTYLS